MVEVLLGLEVLARKVLARPSAVRRALARRGAIAPLLPAEGRGVLEPRVVEQVGKKAVGPGLVAGVLVAGEAATCLCCASAGEGLP